METSTSLTPRLRVTKNSDEIEAVIKKMKEMDVELTVWQNVKGERVLSKAAFLDLNPYKNTVTLKPKNKSVLEFDRKVSIYIHGPFESLLFKVDAKVNSEKNIVFPYPGEVRMLEKREDPRILVEHKKYNEVCFQKQVGYKKSEFTCVLLDISRKGMAFRITAHNITKFANNDTITLTKVCGILIPGDFHGQIIYMRPDHYDEQFGTKQVFRVGVTFTLALGQEILAGIQTTQ